MQQLRKNNNSSDGDDKRFLAGEKNLIMLNREITFMT